MQCTKRVTIHLTIFAAVLSACGTTEGTQVDLQSRQAMASPLQGCDFSGTWGVKFTIPVHWGASPAILAGDGEVEQWALARRTTQGSALHDQLTLCGVRIPAHHATEMFHHETYSIEFPDALFDSDSLPQVGFNSVVVETASGAQFASGGVAVVLGLKLQNPESAVWPVRGTPIERVDDDRDGNDGITVTAAAHLPYMPPPVNLYSSKRAAKFFIALRNVVNEVHGTVVSCDQMVGVAKIPVIAGKAALNSRILGCQRTDGGICTAAETAQVDKSQSGYSLAGDAMLTMQRLPEGTTCATVRNM